MFINFSKKLTRPQLKKAKTVGCTVEDKDNFVLDLHKTAEKFMELEITDAHHYKELEEIVSILKTEIEKIPNFEYHTFIHFDVHPLINYMFFEKLAQQQVFMELAEDNKDTDQFQSLIDDDWESICKCRFVFRFRNNNFKGK